MIRGYLGGTYDPVHLGHLTLAREALERFSLEKVYFVPSRHPPHKVPGDLSPFEHRLAMLDLALEDDDAFEVADLESDEAPSYTVDMLERTAGQGTRPYFIMGMDSLEEMHTWKDPLRITELANVVVGTRPGYEPSSVGRALLERVQLFEFTGVWISSSAIRERVRCGESISYLVPGPVESYIRSRGLYGTEKGH